MVPFLYTWHRRLAIIVLFPVIAWCVSGLTHPMMAHWFKISPVKFTVPQSSLSDLTKAIPLDSVLLLNNLTTFRQFRVVHFFQRSYYQVHLDGENIQYLDVSSGKCLDDGDRRYAEWLARYFFAEQNAKVALTERLESFTPRYKRINRLLPVYRVQFERSDDLEVYVETTSSRYGTANDRYRKMMNWVFTQFHNWDFLNFNPGFKHSILFLLALLTFLVALSGVLLYGVFWKQYLSLTGRRATSTRRWHRSLGVLVSLAMLAFAFSGAFHVFKKFTPDVRQQYFVTDTFHCEQVKQNPFDFLPMLPAPASSVSLVRMGEDLFYQYSCFTGKRGKQFIYIHADRGTLLPKGDDQYAQYLSLQFTGRKAGAIQSTRLVTDFKTEKEYGFINKRLPVIRIAYEGPNQLRQYIETSTGKLSAQFVASDRYESMSFLILHKYHSLGFLGKSLRDTILVIANLGVLVVTLFGLILFLKRKA